jgi:hypothetical protein
MGNTNCCDGTSDADVQNVSTEEAATSGVPLGDVAAAAETITADAKSTVPEKPNTETETQTPTAETKTPAAETPAAGKAKRWSVTLRKEEGKTLGMGIFVPKDNSTLSVKLIQEGGLVEAHNKSNPDLAIQVLDLIVIVNSATLPEEIMKQFKEAQTLEVTFERSVAPKSRQTV